MPLRAPLLGAALCTLLSAAGAEAGLLEVLSRMACTPAQLTRRHTVGGYEPVQTAGAGGEGLKP